MARPRKQKLNHNLGFEGTSAVIYARVSTEEQAHGYSIDAQVKMMEEYANRKGLKIVRRFVEADKASSSTHERAKIRELSEFVKQNPGCVVLVEKTDRFARNYRDILLVEELIQDFSTRFVLVRDNQELDHESNANAWLQFDMTALIARNFIRNLQAEIKKGMNEKARQGILPTVAPLGYLNVKIGNEKVIVPDPERAPLVRRLFDAYASGRYSIATCRELAIEIGLRTKKGKIPASASLHRLLQNKTYNGWVEWNDICVRGKHEAIVSDDVFNRGQDILHGRNTSVGFGKLEFPYKGLLHCARCGCAMTGEIKKCKYRYMRCTGKRGPCSGVKVIREADLTDQIANALKSISIPQELLPKLQASLKDVLDKETEFQTDKVDRLQKQERSLKAKLQNLYRDRIEGIVTPEIYDGLRNEFQSELESVQGFLAGMDKAERNLFADGVTMLELASDAWRIFLEAEPMDRRNILHELGWNSPVLDGIVQVSMREPFQSLYELAQKCGENGLESASDEDWYSGRDSNPRPSP